VGEKVHPLLRTVDNVFLAALYEEGAIGLTLFVGAFAVFLVRTRPASTTTLHWYAPLALASAGAAFNWDAYSTFNILVVASMALTMWHVEQREMITKGRVPHPVRFRRPGPKQPSRHNVGWRVLRKPRQRLTSDRLLAPRAAMSPLA
jgi:hypothetical protein